VVSGIIMWALLFVSLLVLGAAGVRASFTAMERMSHWELGDQRTSYGSEPGPNRRMAAQGERDDRERLTGGPR
jgi:hypothetical protein